MNAYKEDPQLALAALEKIAEEIPSGVSAQDVGRLVPTLSLHPEEITNGLHEKIISELKTNINAAWTENKLAEKLEAVKDLKRSDVPVIRPGINAAEELINSVKAKHLRALKGALDVRVNAVKEENHELEKQLKAKINLINNQMDEVKSCALKM